MKFERLVAHYITPEMVRAFPLGEVEGQERIVGPKRHLIVLQGFTDQGEEAWGSIPTTRMPIYTSESTIEAWALLQEVGGAVLNREITSSQEMVRCLGYLVGHQVLKSGFANLYLDALATRQQVSLPKLVGGTKAEVKVGVSLPTSAPLETIQQVVAESGYERIKLKVSPVQVDIEKVAAVRAAFPDLMLMVDANSSFNFDLPEHRALLAQLAELDLLMIEQPLAHDDIVQHVALQAWFDEQGLPGRVCLDESIHTFQQLKQAVEGGIPIINIKIARVGGLDIAKQMIEYCQQYGVDTWIGGMIGITAVDKAHSLAMASHPGVTLPADISGTDAYFKPGQDPTVEPMVRQGSKIAVPTSPGRGWDVDRHILDSVTKYRQEFYQQRSR